MTVRMYWACETTATLRLLGGWGAHGGGEGRGHIVSPRAQLVYPAHLSLIDAFFELVFYVILAITICSYTSTPAVL